MTTRNDISWFLGAVWRHERLPRERWRGHPFAEFTRGEAKGPKADSSH
jgi:hypothetical protein